MGTGGKLKLEEGTAGGTHVGFKAPDTEVASELLWTLPSLDGSAGQILATDGSKNLVWVANLDSSLQSAIDAETTARTVADSSLQASVNSEATSRITADSSLQANIISEASARTVADSSLQASVNSEATARATADSSLQANIISEASARTVADSSLQASVNSEATSRITADSSLQASVNSEATSRITADSSLQANINASGTKVFEGTATYVDGLGTFSHGYSSLPLVMTLLVDATGGFWEQHDASAYFKISTTQVAPLGVTTLVAAFGGSTNVKLFVTKTQVQ